MRPIPKAGVVLGVLVAVWTFVMGFTGWYKHPTLLNLFWVMILIQIGVLVWGLRLTALEGRSYWGQVGAGTLMSLAGGVIIFLGSMLFTTVVFPDYFTELRQLGEETMRAQGISESDIKATLDLQAPMQTPFMQAFLGFIGTLITGLIVSLIAGAIIRKKSGPVTAESKQQS
jgi:hypothetical protein